MQLQQSTFISIAALCLPLGLMVACGTSSVEFGRSGAGGSDTTFTTSSSGDGGNGSDTKTCGEVELEAQPAKGRLLVLLDRSCSMNGRLRISETEKSSKWHMALGALGKVAMTQQGPEFANSGPC